ncbi:hypothetical protein ACOSP7_012737 [Xanthoceras sorbifolium]
MFPKRLCFHFVLVILLVQSSQLKLALSYSSNFTDQSALLSFQSAIRFDPTNPVLGGNWTLFFYWVGVSCGRNRQRVTSLNLSDKGLHGTISPHIGNLSFLVSLDLRNNSFYGKLPNEISRLHRLKELLFQFNQLEGNIPPPIHHCRKLQLLSLESNRLSGGIPEEFGLLSSLRELNLHMNYLNGAIPSSLGNISTIQIMNLRETGLTGSLPSSLLNLSSVVAIDLVKNNISGTLPMDICHYWPHIQSLNLSFNKFKLVDLYLGYNMLDGSIPTEIGSLHKLELLDLGGNNLIGHIPMSIGSLKSLTYIELSSNNLSGRIPSTIGGLERLQRFHVDDNKIEGFIPKELCSLQQLGELSFRNNEITGQIPDCISNLTRLQILLLSANRLNLSIPVTLWDLENHWFLNLSSNFFSASLSPSIRKSNVLENLDLSWNQISGNIPSVLGAFESLSSLDLSKNSFEGMIPQSFVPSCASSSSKSRPKEIILKYILPGAGLVIIIAFAVTYLLWKNQGRALQTPRILSDGTTVAVKVLNLELEDAFKSFDAECKVLRAIRHRNLVKIISSCSNPELRALILQYMPNGNLEKWLYLQNYNLDILQRVSIMVDVASALEYLHHGQSEPVVHCDLKPSNILLDEDMVAHVKYGSEGKVSTRGDVYSYGMMLLEIFTAKKPTDEMFAKEMTLRKWVAKSLPDKLMHIIDGALLDPEEGDDLKATHTILLSIIELGLECTEELPGERLDMKEVVVKLNKIKLALLRNRN